jgi:hypothetical protein
MSEYDYDQDHPNHPWYEGPLLAICAALFMLGVLAALGSLA